MPYEITFGEFREMLQAFQQGWTPGSGYNRFMEVFNENDRRIFDKYFVYEEEERKCMDGQRRNFPVSIFKRKSLVSDDTLVDLCEFEWVGFTPQSGHGSEMHIIEAHSRWKRSLSGE
jgi:hypothetical protein